MSAIKDSNYLSWPSNGTRSQTVKLLVQQHPRYFCTSILNGGSAFQVYEYERSVLKQLKQSWCHFWEGIQATRMRTRGICHSQSPEQIWMLPIAIPSSYFSSTLRPVELTPHSNSSSIQVNQLDSSVWIDPMPTPFRIESTIYGLLGEAENLPWDWRESPYPRMSEECKPHCHCEATRHCQLFQALHESSILTLILS